jgi:hypothetical protein
MLGVPVTVTERVLVGLDVEDVEVRVADAAGLVEVGEGTLVEVRGGAVPVGGLVGGRVGGVPVTVGVRVGGIGDGVGVGQKVP